ncbi:hypothetical protein [Burkholderia territorii]|uniref:hypothetical protein n=1 Tax=Burkholderia territorii TaxID=1503055 RepID=UPI000AB38A6E|nr:hypothetical protein [Burkholderia territorii]
MSDGTHLAFKLPRSSVIDRILIPKFYDPELVAAEQEALEKFDLVELGDVLLPGARGSRLGNWIRREHYGSGEIPFVRTSDLVNWRIRPDFKKAVSDDVYQSVKAIQDISPNDILFVAHGTYLVGQVAIIAQGEEKLVLQDHVFRLRIDPESGVHPYLLLAALSTPFVKRQVRARQFSADIIDKIGNRHLGIKVPIPKSNVLQRKIIDTVQGVFESQDSARSEISAIANLQTRMTKERAESNIGFDIPRSSIKSRILIPKFYDPRISDELRSIENESKEKWVPLTHYIERGLISAETGVEVGKMAYGTGNIPFLRTSDIVDLEIRRDPRHCIDEETFFKYRKKAGVNAGDVILVRDGTYLVGSSAIVGQNDGNALICGGLYRLRTLDVSVLRPEALLLALNLPIVRKQLRAFQFTRDVIDTLGKRALDVLVPPLDTLRWLDAGARLGAALARKAEAKVGIGDGIKLADPAVTASASGRPSWSMR